MELSEKQRQLCDASQWDFSVLRALFLNCTLKRTPETSHTQGLIDIARAIMEKNSVQVEVLRPVDHKLAYGVYPDMTEHGWGAWAPVPRTSTPVPAARRTILRIATRRS